MTVRPSLSRVSVVCLALIGAALALGPAHAGERDATASEAARVGAHLGKLGYRSITDVDVVGSTFVVDAISPRGRDVDVILDRATLRVLRERAS